MLRVLTESGIEFQIDTPIPVKVFFIFSVLENLTEKHSFADNRVFIMMFCIDFCKLIEKTFRGCFSMNVIH